MNTQFDDFQSGRLVGLADGFQPIVSIDLSGSVRGLSYDEDLDRYIREARNLISLLNRGRVYVQTFDNDLIDQFWWGSRGEIRSDRGGGGTDFARLQERTFETYQELKRNGIRSVRHFVFSDGQFSKEDGLKLPTVLVQPTMIDKDPKVDIPTIDL